jgi:hypothetical protein
MCAAFLGFLNDNKEILTAIGGLATLAVGVATFAKSVNEYARKNALDRFEKYMALSKRWDDDKDIQKIIHLLDGDKPALKKVPYKARHDFLASYEEISLMYESKLLKLPVAYCMFGYYAIRCLESKNFWRGINKESPAWYLFRRFAEKMQEVERGIVSGKINIKRWDFGF